MKKILSCILTLALVLFLMPTALAAGTQTEVRSANIHLNDYGTSSGPIKSYLYKNGSGLTRVEMNDVFISGELDCVVIEDYDSSFQLLNQRMIEPELPRWGGFFAGEKYNFLIFGQTNEEEDDNKEVIRVVNTTKSGTGWTMSVYEGQIPRFPLLGEACGVTSMRVTCTSILLMRNTLSEA